MGYSLTSTDDNIDYSRPVLDALMDAINHRGNTALGRQLRDSKWKKSDSPRPLYIKRDRTIHESNKRIFGSILIQLFGEKAALACEGCQKRNPIFVDCVARSDMKDGTCGNCAFSASRCSLARPLGKFLVGCHVLKCAD